MPLRPLVLAITGASGAIYGQRLLEVLLATDLPIHLTISDSARMVMQHELGLQIDLGQFSLSQVLPATLVNLKSAAERVHYHHYKDFMAPIASGSHKTCGMIVCPCSGSTLSGIAAAASQNLIQRAADVHLKERRPLILVTRETPLSLIQIDNLRTACAAGATILPGSPGFYHGAESVIQLVDFIVARILDHLDIEHSLMKRWGE
jgi:flavin prenyltransferase